MSRLRSDEMKASFHFESSVDAITFHCLNVVTAVVTTVS